MERLISGFGLVVMVGLAWLLSSNRKRINWKTVISGLLLQIGMALLILTTTLGRITFDWLGAFFGNVQRFTDVGAQLVFGENFADHYFAFKVLPTIIFFSTFMSVLYYVGVMQRIVNGMAWMMQKTLGTSGAESLSAAANIFVGQTEAPLLIKPYMARMTRSEVMSVMVGGFATIAGGVMAAYIGMGIDAGHLLTASVISAPAALVMAKIIEPETEVAVTAGVAVHEVPQTAVNLFDAATQGAVDGLKLAMNVGAMLIAFTALMAMVDAGVVWVASLFDLHLTLGMLVGYVFSPFAWLMGVPSSECLQVGELLGIRTVTNEFLAYQKMGEWLKDGSGVELSERSRVIVTYALCGFANFASIGIQIGGIGGLVPEQQATVAELGMRAMIGGTLSCFMTACIAGILVA